MLSKASLFALAALSLAAAADQAPSPQPAAPAAQSREPSPQPGQATKKPSDPEAELQRSINESGNDRAALVRNLEDYLRRFPDAPRKLQVYRAIVESAVQLRDQRRALEYAERIIALRPGEVEMMLFAVELLERVEKTAGEGRPARTSQAEWDAEQKKLRMSVYLIRGRLQMERHDYAAAAADMETSYRLLPSPTAALRLGEIAELRKDYSKAIEHYVAAFVLPDQAGLPVDRSEVRRKLGNLWQLVHGSEAGLGERLLQAYDRLAVEPRPAESGRHNKGATAPFEFVLRRADDAAPVKLADWKGKVVVLNFWATWCLPCRELEPLFEQVGRQFENRSDVFFLAVNDDEDESRVKPYIDREKIRIPVVFSDGLDTLLDIHSLPTVIVLDRAGKIVYRAQGFDPDGFAPGLSGAIERALAGTS